MKPFHFEITHTSKKSRARVGVIHTPHGKIHTPSFVGVGTNGTLKSIDPAQLELMGMDLMFCNTYHLMLQPGIETIKKAGGIHSFINRKTPIITDSGGFQVFSLAYGSVASEIKSKGTKQASSSVISIKEEGVTFRSYRDGSKIFLSPETSVSAQKDIGADIIIPFDELPPYHIDAKYLSSSLDRTHRWQKRSLDFHLKDTRNQAMYGIIHGGTDTMLREKSALFIDSLPFDGYAIGGSMGKTKQEMHAMLSLLLPKLRHSPPRHLLGIGDEESIDASIPLGIDTFDSAYPTKAARHGTLLHARGKIKITSGKYAHAFMPIDDSCSCYTCKNYTLSYLHHLFKAHELSAYTLASIHNTFHMVQKMAKYREEIIAGKI